MHAFLIDVRNEQMNKHTSEAYQIKPGFAVLINLNGFYCHYLLIFDLIKS